MVISTPVTMAASSGGATEGVCCRGEADGERVGDFVVGLTYGRRHHRVAEVLARTVSGGIWYGPRVR
ncbi:hypothetical protein, partial [Nocardia neocaledoniensis]|uniref:hypothetical protein n=1 Tax=Nocardia neocaledoniensis TaxID=236511 RepID=UPI001C9A0793